MYKRQAINSATYGEEDGMLFVALSNGVVQAFDAATLQSLWIYHDPLGGQPNCPLTYYKGYVYTGFWNQEDLDANYVCLSATDEKTDSGSEEKLARWTYTSKGGFYLSLIHIWWPTAPTTGRERMSWAHRASTAGFSLCWPWTR